MVFKAFCDLNKPHVKKIAYIIGLSLLLTLIYILSPIVQQRLIDIGFGGQNYSAVVVYVLIGLLMNLVGHFVSYVQSLKQYELQYECKLELKHKSFLHIMNLKNTVLKKQGVYKLLADSNRCIEKIVQLSSPSVLGVFTQVVSIFGYLIGLIVVNPILAVFTLFFIPVKYLIFCVFGKNREKIETNLMRLFSDMSLWQSDIFGGTTEFKLWSMQDQIADIFKKYNIKCNNSMLRLNKNTGLNSFANQTLNNLLINFLYIVSATLIFQQELSLGEMFAFISYAGILFSPIDMLMQLRLTIAGIKPAIKEYNDFADLPEEKKEGLDLGDRGISKIEFKGINVIYDSKTALENINFVIERGEKVAILGDNGSGKTTLISVLMQLIEPTSGAVIVNNRNIQEFEINKYWNVFSLMSQDTKIFNATLSDNVSMFNSKRSREEISTQLKNSLLKFISGFCEGMETQAGLEGANLSGGEKRKIAMSRALTKNASVLILDEPTANVDEASIELIKEQIDKCDYDIIIVITHDRELVGIFDRVLVLKDGKIIYDGIPERN